MKICDQETGCLEHLTQSFQHALTCKHAVEQNAKVREG